jgi:hypothetical protein
MHPDLNQLLMLIALLCMLPLAAGCDLDERNARAGMDPEVELMLNVRSELFPVNSFIHSAGGFLVCRESQGNTASIARVDAAGEELWRSELSGSKSVIVIHVDDLGRIYLISSNQELLVLDEGGSQLWNLPKLHGNVGADNFGNAGDDIYLLANEEMMCVDHDGKPRWIQTRYGKSQSFAVLRRSGEQPLLYYLGVEPTADISTGKSLKIWYGLDGDGKGLWRKQEQVLDTIKNPVDPGRLQITEDGRKFIRLKDELLELDDTGQATLLLSFGEDDPDAKRFLDGWINVTPDGNYLISNNNHRLLSESLHLLEFTPEGEIISKHEFTQADHKLVSEADYDGVGYYDVASRRVYLYFATERADERGWVTLLDLAGTKLAEYRTGSGRITRFFTLDDGTVCAERSGGDLLRLPQK